MSVTQRYKKINDVIQPQVLLLVITLACALMIRLHNLGEASFWLDEVSTLYISELPLSTLWLSGYDTNPPLFYTIEKIALLFGDSEIVLRLPSVFFGVFTIYFVSRAALEVAGYNAALVAAVFLTFSSGNIEYSQEARAYALLGFCISGAFLGLVRLDAYLGGARHAISTGKFLKNGGFLYLLFTLAALYTHNIAVFFVFSAQVYFLWLWLYMAGRDPKIIILWSVLNALALVLWLPWLTISLDIMAGPSSFDWLQQVSFNEAAEIIRSVHGFREIWRGRIFLDLSIVALTVAGFYALRKKPGIFVLCLATLATSTLLIWLFGFYKPVLLFRTILWGTLITAFVVGVGAAKFPSKYTYVIILVLAVLGVKSTSTYFESNRAEREKWRAVESYLDAEARNGDTYIFCANYVAKSFLYNAINIAENSMIYGYNKWDMKIRRADIQVREGKSRLFWEEETVPISEPVSAERLWFINAYCKSEDVDYAAFIEQNIQDAGFENMNYKRYPRIEISGYYKKPL